MTVITFAIPYYTHAEYLERAVNSVFNQSCKDWKLLIVDDSPPSNAMPAEMVTHLRNRNIRCEKNPVSLGIAGNWNRCLELADTEFVTILHDDDELKPDYAKHVLQAFHDHQEASAIFTRAGVINENGSPIFSLPDRIKYFLRPTSRRLYRLEGSSGVMALLRGNFIMCPTLCFNKNRLGNQRFNTRYRYVMDLDMTVNILLNGGSLVGLPTEDYLYRRHITSTSSKGTKNCDMLEEEAGYYECIADELRKSGKEHLAKLAKRRLMMRLKVLYYLFPPGGRELLTMKLRLLFR